MSDVSFLFFCRNLHLKKVSFLIKNNLEVINIIITIAAVIIAIILGVLGGYSYRKNMAEKIIGSAEEEAKRIIAEAQEKGQSEKKEAVIEAKEEIHRMRQELDRDTKETKTEETS